MDHRLRNEQRESPKSGLNLLTSFCGQPLEIKCPEHFYEGHCKSWTLDCGLDHGLDYGLRYGLHFGLLYGEMRVY